MQANTEQKALKIYLITDRKLHPVNYLVNYLLPYTDRSCLYQPTTMCTISFLNISLKYFPVTYIHNLAQYGKNLNLSSNYLNLAE